jgi:hypothetical protein
MADIICATEIIDKLLLNAYNRDRHYRGVTLEYKGIRVTKEGISHLYQVDVPLINLLDSLAQQNEPGIDFRFIDALDKYYSEDKWPFTNVQVELNVTAEKIELMFYSDKNPDLLYPILDNINIVDRVVNESLRCRFIDAKVGKAALHAAVDHYLSELNDSPEERLPEFVLENSYDGEIKELFLVWHISYTLSEEEVETLKNTIKISESN